MKKELKIDTDFKVFKGSNFTIYDKAFLTISKDGKVSFELYVIEKTKPELYIPHSLLKMNLLIKYFKGSVFNGVEIIDAEIIIKPKEQTSYNTFRGFVEVPKSFDNEIVINCIGRLT